VSTAVSEWNAGRGAREGGVHNFVDDWRLRPFLLDDVALVKRTRMRLAAALLGGLDREVTGAPRHCRAAYLADGCSEKQQKRLLGNGVVIDFSSPPQPDVCGGNNLGAADPAYTPWLYGRLEESLVLRILVEQERRPLIVLPINVVEKSGFDAVTSPWRLRLIYDCRVLNEYVQCDEFIMESLHQAQHLFKPDDVLLVFDISAAFYHLDLDPSMHEYLGFQLGGRYFTWRATPMGLKCTPVIWQTLVCIMARAWRAKYGIRLICFVDDFGILCKPEQRDDMIVFIQEQFKIHGLLVQPKKCDVSGRARKLLGIGIDIPHMRFFVPADKKGKILVGINGLLAARRGRSEVRLRTLAKTCGRLMACLVAMGPCVRQMTRMMYAFIAVRIGVDPNATRRQLKVAWDVFAVIDAEVERELLFFAWLMPQHEGGPIRLLTPIPSVVVGFDAADLAFGGFLDNGDGRRLLVRELFTLCEQEWSSTARELTCTLRGLLAFAGRLGELLKTQRSGPLVVLLIGDNQLACVALEIGSRTPTIHHVCAAIFSMAWSHGIVLLP
jgi:hypothetical protein